MSLDEMPEKELRRAEMALTVRNTRVTFAQDHHSNTRGERLNFSAYPHIAEMYNTLAYHLVVQGSVQSFKLSSVYSFVHTPSGWVTMGSLKVGDVVSTPDGKGAKISQVQPHGVQRLYRFTLDDGRIVETGRDHLWKVLRGKQRKTLSAGRKSLQWNLSREFEVLHTSEIMEAMADGTQRFTIPVPTVPVEKPAKKLPLDPYFLGLMLGDGSLGEALTFTKPDTQLSDWIAAYVRKEFGVAFKPRKTKPYQFTFSDAVGFIVGGTRQIKDAFESLGLLGKRSWDKFIPEIYKNGSAAQRLAVLQGLLDTDGAACDHGGVTIRLASEQLIKDIQEIVWSLGGAARYTRRETYHTNDGYRKKCRDTYLLNISLPCPQDAFRLARKKEKLSTEHRRVDTLGPKIVKCEVAGEDECQCIVLDNEEHLYIMDNYVVTHNSEMLIVDHLAMAYSGLSVFYVIPKYEARVTYVQNRINRCVERVPFYKDIVGEGFFDSVAIKSFGKGVIKYVSSNVKADFREYPADVAFVEEVDECNTENLALVQDRLRASPFQFTRWVGNPKNPNEGINKHYLDSDRREWHVPCYACGKYSQLDWFKTIVKPVTGDGGSVVDYRLKDTEWTPSIGRDIYPICPCGGRLERASSKGIWRPTNPIPTPVVGYHTSMLVSLLNDISGMYVRFKKALVDPVLLKAFYNSELGLPFSAAGSKVTYELLDSCRQVGYNMAITESSGHSPEGSHPGPCSMGVDVGHAFDVRISYLTGSKNRVALFIGKVKSTSELYDLMARYNVRVAVFDAEPEAHLVREIQANAASTEVWMCKYKQQEGSTGSIQYNHDDRMMSIDRTEALDKSFAAFKQRKNRIPENYRVILDGEYGEELCMPVREAIMDAKERRRYVWTKGKDHSRHADTYDLLASEMLNESGFEVSIG
jgi:hypothetical protein